MATPTGYVYHGYAYGINGKIDKPVQEVIDNHACCGGDKLTPGKPYKGQHKAHVSSGVMSYKSCATSVNALPQDRDGFFRTELQATILDLQFHGDVTFSAGSIKLGVVSVYHPKWKNNPVRVLPVDCSFENVTVHGMPVMPRMPAPFTYSKDQREAYLTSETLDPKMDQEVRDTIAASSSRYYYIPNFGRIYYCEWTIVPGGTWHHVHQMSMVRMAMGSPIAADLSGSGGGVDGH